MSLDLINYGFGFDTTLGTLENDALIEKYKIISEKLELDPKAKKILDYRFQQDSIGLCALTNIYDRNWQIVHRMESSLHEANRQREQEEIDRIELEKRSAEQAKAKQAAMEMHFQRQKMLERAREERYIRSQVEGRLKQIELEKEIQRRIDLIQSTKN